LARKIYRGVIKKDRKTKVLCRRLRSGDIALIAHQDLDELAAQELVEKGVLAVVNAFNTFSSNYPAGGAKFLLQQGVYILDMVGENIFSRVAEGEVVTIRGEHIFSKSSWLGKGRVIKKEFLENSIPAAEMNLKKQLDQFVLNTLEYARKEKDLILGNIDIPEINTAITGKHVLVVARGKNYKRDLRAVRYYIKEMKPVLVGVDGGADALLEMGFKPHIIIGDMDSTADVTLKKVDDIIVHAYPDGRAPGMERISRLGLDARLVSAPGTSEDIALLLAYEKKARLIVVVGSHSHMIDFLEKGRKGMASTFLVRLKVGDRLVDARGLAHLYQGKIKWQYLSILFLAAIFPVVILAVFSPLVRHFFYLLSWRFGLQ